MISTEGFQRVTRDIIDLCELQMQLLAIDSRESMRKAISAVVLVSIAGVLGIVALTVLLLSAAWGLHDIFGWSLSAALLTVGVVAGLITMILMFAGLRAIRAAGRLLEEPRGEFAENLRWLKGVLLTPDRSARYQLRRESFNDRYARAGPVERP